MLTRVAQLQHVLALSSVSTRGSDKLKKIILFRLSSYILSDYLQLIEIVVTFFLPRQRYSLYLFFLVRISYVVCFLTQIGSLTLRYFMRWVDFIRGSSLDYANPHVILCICDLLNYQPAYPIFIFST